MKYRNSPFHTITISFRLYIFEKKTKTATLLLMALDNFSSVQFSSVAQSCPTICDPMNRSTPGLPVHHQLPEFTQTHVHRVSDAIQPSHPHVHRVSDAIQPSHPLSSPSPPAPNPSQHQRSTLCMRWPKYYHSESEVKSLSRVCLFATPWTVAY